jgi:hypothetical protein
MWHASTKSLTMQILPHAYACIRQQSCAETEMNASRIICNSPRKSRSRVDNEIGTEHNASIQGGDGTSWLVPGNVYFAPSSFGNSSKEKSRGIKPRPGKFAAYFSSALASTAGYFLATSSHVVRPVDMSRTASTAATIGMRICVVVSRSLRVTWSPSRVS